MVKKTKYIERAVKNDALPTKERMEKRDIVVKDGRMYSISDFNLDDTYYKGGLNKPGKYDRHTRYAAAKHFSSIALAGIIGQGSGGVSERVGKSNVPSDPLASVIAKVAQAAWVRSKLSKESDQIVWKILVEGYNMKQALGHYSVNTRPKKLCAALDDLVDAMSAWDDKRR